MCHSRTFLAGIHDSAEWIPAFAGMTSFNLKDRFLKTLSWTHFNMHFTSTKNDQNREKSNDMNKQEAINLLRETLDNYRKYSYAELQSRLGEIETCQVKGEFGAQYQVEVQVMWDNKHQQNIRVIGAIDDGGWRAFLPLTESFIMAPDGSFVGE